MADRCNNSTRLLTTCTSPPCHACSRPAAPPPSRPGPSLQDFFHFVFMTASCYIAMLFTNWAISGSTQVRRGGAGRGMGMGWGAAAHEAAVATHPQDT